MLTLLHNLSPTDSTLAVVICALVTHLMFNRLELNELPAVAAFLVGLPTALSLLLTRHYGIVGGIALAFAVFHATLATSVVLYRISPFHPLARYPGPLLAKITKWYWALTSVWGHQHTKLKRMHDIYGDAVRIGPNELSFRDVSLIQPMMGAQGMPKGPMWEGRAFKPPVLALVGLRDVAEHARRRQPWNRAFSTAALKGYEPVVAKHGAQLVEILAERRVVDFKHWIHLFTFDIMSDALFGGSIEAKTMTTEDKDGVQRSMISGFKSAQIFEHIPWLGGWVRYFPQLATAATQFRVMCMQRGMQRLQQGSKQKDLFYYLNNEDGEEKQTSDQATVLSDSGTAIIAGSDTTASVFSSLVYCLLKNPDVYKRLQAEVDEFYPPEENSLDPKHHTKMPYLEAVINETMRIYTIFPSGSQRSPELGTGGVAIGPHYIPEHTSVRMHFWSVHRDPRNFSHPETFFPDRWLIAAGLQAAPETLTHNPNAFIPFSFGPWNCVGKNLAMLELKCVTTHMVQRLSLRFQDGYDPAEWDRDLEDRFVITAGKLPIIAERRF